MDLRGFIKVLEDNQRLFRVKTEVEKDWELSCIARHVASMAAKKRYGLIFENPKGFDIPVAVNLFASRELYMMALDVNSIEDVYAKWVDAHAEPLPPEMVDDGPCKEIILIGEDVDLTRLPIPTWTPTHDPAPFITAGCAVIKDPETGIRNMGTYRLMLKGKNRLGILILPAKDSGIIYSKYEEMDKPMEIAIALGTPPTICMTSVARIPYGVDEMSVSGALQGEPIRLVPCETVDLEIPSEAEIVIEGVIPPKEREKEGPFGEFAGFMGPEGMRPIVNVTALTYRSNPIYHAFLEQKPPSEGAVLKDVVQEGVILNALKNLGIPGVKKIYVTEAGAQYNVIVAIRKMHPGQVRRVMQGCWAAYAVGCKMVIVVEEDCDVYDPRDVDWHLATRVQPDRDVLIVSKCTGHSLDPSMPAEERAWGSKMGIDATRSFHYPPVSLPPAEMLNKVKDMWERYGLPKL